MATSAFAAIEAGAFVWLIWIGRSQWFVNDEWDFLAGRVAFSANDLFRPHNEHWSFLPVLAYRALWALFGLKTYVPYLAVLVCLHLAAAALLRMLMRRAGVGPWVATITATVLVLFGAGSFNIEFAFQIGFVGALVLGLIAVLVTDHCGPFDRRDAIGLSCCLSALLCSGVGVAMAVVVSVSTLLRRGWRVAALYAAVPAAAYITWLAVIGRKGYRQAVASPHEAWTYLTSNLRTIFQSVGQLPGTGALLWAVFVAGLYLAWRDAGTGARERLNTVIGLVAGACFFLIATALGRGHVPTSFGIFAASRGEPQIVYIVAALLLVPLAVAAAAVIRRWRWLGPAVCVLLLVGIPRNARLLDRTTRTNAKLENAFKDAMLATAALPIAHELPRSYQPSPVAAREVTMGWLLDGVASGKIPSPRPQSAEDQATLTLKLLLRPSPSPPPANCTPLRDHAVLRIGRDESIGVRNGAVSIVAVADDGARSAPVTYSPALHTKTQTLLSALPLTVAVSPMPNARNVLICRA